MIGTGIQLTLTVLLSELFFLISKDNHSHISWELRRF